jgi:DNA repair exonuclease SbcCD ATPase subunit
MQLVARQLQARLSTLILTTLPEYISASAAILTMPDWGQSLRNETKRWHRQLGNLIEEPEKPTSRPVTRSGNEKIDGALLTEVSGLQSQLTERDQKIQALKTELEEAQCSGERSAEISLRPAYGLIERDNSLERRAEEVRALKEQLKLREEELRGTEQTVLRQLKQHEDAATFLDELRKIGTPFSACAVCVAELHFRSCGRSEDPKRTCCVERVHSGIHGPPNQPELRR